MPRCPKCAGTGHYPDVPDEEGDEPMLCPQVAYGSFRTALCRHGIETAEQLPRAAILATARLAACVPTRDLADRIAALPELRSFQPGQFENAFGHYGPGRYAWFFTDLYAFEKPVPERGHQGLWPLSEEDLLHGLAITGQPQCVTKPPGRSLA